MADDPYAKYGGASENNKSQRQEETRGISRTSCTELLGSITRQGEL
jgi:hypothetical protein